MKRNLLLLFAATALLFSCSSDKDDDNTNPDNIVGTWDLTALEINPETATDDEEFAAEILDFLSATNCYILTFTFNEDGTVIEENSGNYLEVNVNPGGTGLDIPCPTEQDTDVDEYTFDGSTLVYIDEEGETSIQVEVDGNTIRISATDLDVENFDDGGTLVFTRR